MTLSGYLGSSFLGEGFPFVPESATCPDGYAQLFDPVSVTSVCFLSNPDFKPKIHEVGLRYNPLGYPLSVKETDGTKGRWGTLIVVATSDAMNDACETLFMTVTPLQLTLPNGVSYWIAWEPATDHAGQIPFSYMDNPDIPPVLTWTQDFFEVEAP